MNDTIIDLPSESVRVIKRRKRKTKGKKTSGKLKFSEVRAAVVNALNQHFSPTEKFTSEGVSSMSGDCWLDESLIALMSQWPSRNLTVCRG